MLLHNNFNLSLSRIRRQIQAYFPILWMAYDAELLGEPYKTSELVTRYEPVDFDELSTKICSLLQFRSNFSFPKPRKASAKPLCVNPCATSGRTWVLEANSLGLNYLLLPTLIHLFRRYSSNAYHVVLFCWRCRYAGNQDLELLVQ